MRENDFNFFIPIGGNEIEKAARKEKTDESRYDNMIIEGLASDDKKDIDEEILEPDGYIVDVFLKNGYFNYEHLAKKSSKFIIGEPTSAKVSGNKFFVKGKLWSKSQVARDLWDTCIEMKESGSARRPGFSIEGKALQRDPMNPKRITKALITNCAITFNPVNQNSYMDIVKGVQKEDYIEPEYEQVEGNGDSIYTFEKNGKKYKVTKDFKVQEIVEKAMTVENTKCMAPESLDSKPKNIVDINKSISTILKYKELGLFDESFTEKMKNNIKNIFLS